MCIRDRGIIILHRGIGVCFVVGCNVAVHILDEHGGIRHRDRALFFSAPVEPEEEEDSIPNSSPPVDCTVLTDDGSGRASLPSLRVMVLSLIHI